MEIELISLEKRTLEPSFKSALNNRRKFLIKILTQKKVSEIYAGNKNWAMKLERDGLIKRVKGDGWHYSYTNISLTANKSNEILNKLASNHESYYKKFIAIRNSKSSIKTKMRYNNGELLRCYQCGYLFFKNGKLICPLCENQGTFLRKNHIHISNFDIIEQNNRDVIYRFREGKKGRMEGFPEIIDPQYYVVKDDIFTHLYWSGKFLKTYVNSEDLLSAILDLVHPGLIDAIQKHNNFLRKEDKGRIPNVIPPEKVLNCVKFYQVGNIHLVLFIPRLKGYIRLLHQLNFLHSNNTYGIDKINHDYESQINLEKQIDEFVNSTLKSLKEDSQ